MDLRTLRNREKLEKNTKYICITEGNSVTKSKKVKDYDYYVCDYCKKEIRLNKKHVEDNGGLIQIKINSLEVIQLALCNNCLKPALSEINKEYKTNF